MPLENEENLNKPLESADVPADTPADTPAGSAATDTTDEAPKSALDAVTKAFAASQEPKTAPPDVDAAAKTGDQPAVEAPADIMGKIPKSEWDAMAAPTRTRIQQFREKVSALNTSVEAMTPKAKIHDDLSSWMSKTGVTQDDFVGALEVAALFRTDPIEALRRLEPVIEALKKHSGDALPDDLSQEVNDGIISAERAKELARLRSEETRLRSQSTARSQADVQNEQQTQHQANIQHATDSVKSWEDRWKTSDPDYPKKSPLVWDRISAKLHENGYPTDSTTVLKICNEAKTHVETHLSGMFPVKRAINPINQSGNASNASARPSSSLDAVTRALEAANAA